MSSSGVVATWVGSVGVIGTLLVTAWAVTLEALSRRRDRKRWYAEAVGAWYDGGNGERTRLTISNATSLPIYEVVVSLVFIQGAAPRTIEDWVRLAIDNEDLRQLEYGAALAAIGPGEWHVHVPGGWAALAARPGCEIGFTDAAGQNWIRRAGGELLPLHKSAIDHYGIDRPVDFEAASRGA